MKVLTLFATLLFLIALVSGTSNLPRDASAQRGKKPPETIILSKESRLGSVVFEHANHFSENRSPDGTKLIRCVECHHVAQPLAEAMKHPPHKTAYPPDRTTTLTAGLLEKDPNTQVPRCTDCHARAETKPKLMAEIPSLKFEGAAEATVLNNQEAFHRNCGGCHDEVLKARPALEPLPPTSKKCTSCHKKTLA